MDSMLAQQDPQPKKALTFEQWLAEKFPDADWVAGDHLAQARRMYDGERLVEEHMPAELPPCPKWCTLDAGHGYDSFMGGVAGPDDLDFTRIHYSSTDERPLVAVSQMEHQDVHGVVRLDDAAIYLSAEADLDAEQAEAYATDLRAAALLLRQIGAQ